MTVQEILTDVFEQIGEPSNYLPYTTAGDPSTFDITLVGAQRLLGWLNRAQQTVSNWKFRDGRILRLRNLFSRAYFQTYVYTDTATDGDDSEITLPVGASTVDDTYNGWLVEIADGTGEGQVRLIIDYDGTGLVATVHKAWDTNPDDTSVFLLHKNFEKFVPSTASDAAYHIPLSPVTEMCAVMKVRDLVDQFDLTPPERTNVFTNQILTSGNPVTYREYGNELQFDVAVDSVRSYELLYVKYPTALSTASQVPEMPIPLHDALTMWCTAHGHKMNRDTQMAYSVKRDLIDFMETVRESRELSTEMVDGTLVLGV